MKKEYPAYSFQEFVDDLRLRSRKKKRAVKSSLARFGRYRRMEKLLQQYELTGNVDTALKALKLRRYMTRPYEVLIRIKDLSLEFTLSPLIPIEAIEKLVADIKKCATEQQATELVQQCRDSHAIG
ncbi:hypothetical protein [Pedobacter sp. ASV28]|uniref:hypothetical protein n=1 Tax=Pedobacter sp. ASV28 TaxID=2795123 RepID=UPI0018EDAF05|nr:hypothetical protein [Pedobacter sp. ASV28]